MRRLTLVFFAVLVLAGVTGAMAGAKSKAPSQLRVVDNAAEGHLEAD